MFTFAIEIFCELLLITLIVDTSRYHKTHNQVRTITQTLFQAIKSRTIESKYQLLVERKYLSSIRCSWEGLNKLLDKTSELDTVLFNKMVIKYHKVHGRKSIIAFILKGQFSRKTLKKWVDKEREKENDGVNSSNNNM